MNIQKTLSDLFSAIAIIIIFLIIISAFPVTGNYKILVVQSGSMEPAIHTGSVVIVIPANNYKSGDIITFKSNTGKIDSITHRIVKIESDGITTVFTTRGDANNANDTNTVYPDKIIGKVLFSVPYFGYAVAAAKTKYGFLAMIVFPALLIIYEEAKNIYEEIWRSKYKKEGNTGLLDSNK